MLKVIIGIALCIALAFFLYWNNKSVMITEYDFSHTQVPDGFDGFRITQVSDLQSEYFGKNQETLLKAVDETNPDIIVFTGDLIDRNHTDYDAARIAMEGLLEIAPVYYVNGNHEMALEEEAVQRFYKELDEIGVHVLFDKVEAVEREGESIQLIGLSEDTVFACKGNERSNKVRADEGLMKAALEKMECDVRGEDFVVLLSHEPHYLDIYASPKVDLVFSGHAHGGQIRLPLTDGLYAPGQGPMPKMTSGMHVSGDSTMIISRGLGNSTFPFRVFNRPEVVAVNLIRKKILN